MSNRKILEDEIARLKEEATKTRVRHDKIVQKLQGENEDLRNELASVKDQAIVELQQRHENYQADLTALQEQLEQVQQELEKAQNETKQLRSGSVDINNLRDTISRIVEPVTLEKVAEAYKSKFVVTESASSFVLSPINDTAALPVTYLLPKYGLRVHRTNGHLADLTRIGASEKLVKDEGFQQLLPPSIKSQVYTQYVKRRGTGYSFLELATPRTATTVLISCLVEGGSELEKWRSEHAKDIISCEISKNGDGPMSLYFLLDFPGESPSIQFMPGIDVDFSEADLDSCRQERERALREGCYQEYLRHHFSMT